MRQIWALQSGPPETLSLREEADPSPRAGEVRIRVASIGVNYLDALGRMGKTASDLTPPFVPGLEVSGEVDMVAPGVSGFREGDPVFGYVRGGAYADLVCVPHTQVFPRFPWMDDGDGAALPIDYLTAFVCLMVMGALRPEDTVLIHGANHSAGLAAVHLARIVGATMVGTSPEDHHGFLREQGLDYVIDPYLSDYQEHVRDLTGGNGVSLIMNPYLDIHWRMNYRLLAPAGRLVNYVGFSGHGQRPPSWAQRLAALAGAPAYTPARLQQDSRAVAGMNPDLLWQPGAPVSSWMEQLLDWYDQALFRPYVAQTLGLEQATVAHKLVEDDRALGKVLLRP